MERSTPEWIPEENTQTPMLMDFFILFIASILRSAVFHSSRSLQDKDRKNYMVSAIVKELNKIEAVLDYKTGQYSR